MASIRSGLTWLSSWAFGRLHDWHMCGRKCTMGNLLATSTVGGCTLESPAQVEASGSELVPKTDPVTRPSCVDTHRTPHFDRSFEDLIASFATNAGITAVAAFGEPSQARRVDNQQLSEKSYRTNWQSG